MIVLRHMQKVFLIAFVSVLVVIGTAGFVQRADAAASSLPRYVGSRVTYYATLARFSGSGDMRFRWRNSNDWFFALPKDVPFDEAATDRWVNFIADNAGALFKITGTREENDCSYYTQPMRCIVSVNIDKITPIAAR